jgi:hypothetical protein
MYELKGLHDFVNENISKSELDAIEIYADSLFRKVGIDIEFTGHFLDRLNDIRNKKPINSSEIEGIFRRTYKKHGKKILDLGDEAEAVIKDMKSDINIPFVLSYDKPTGMFDMTMKTVMRKKSFLTSNVTLDINSAQYSRQNDKDLYDTMRHFFHETPEYVFNELYFTDKGFFKEEFSKMIEDDEDDEEIILAFEEWIDLKWKKKVITVNISDFARNTQERMKMRGMGAIPLRDVPNDNERNTFQRNTALKAKQGKNEPVVLIKGKEGYNLLEGWHRTMAILTLGSDGTSDYEKWDKVKLNAWIGTGNSADEISLALGTTD